MLRLEPEHVIIIGAGPVGLAAAAHLLARGLTPLVLEAGTAVAANMRKWAHVRMFSPWQYNVDQVAAALLAESGWQSPDPESFPTGGELVEQYLQPLAERLAAYIRLNRPQWGGIPDQECRKATPAIGLPSPATRKRRGWPQTWLCLWPQLFQDSACLTSCRQQVRYHEAPTITRPLHVL